MIDNMPYHRKAWIAFAKKYGKELTEDEFHEKFSGKKNDYIIPTLLGREVSKEEIEKYTFEKETLYQELYRVECQEIKGLKTLIDVLKRKGLKLAIATTAPEMNRTFILSELGLTNTFSVILGDEHVTRGKPDPEIYLKTAEKLGVKPEECLVFEDSPVGVESAKRAGMKVVGIMTTHTAEELEKTDVLVNDFTELSFTSG